MRRYGQLAAVCASLFGLGLILQFAALCQPFVQGQLLFTVKKNTCFEYEIEPVRMIDVLDGKVFDYLDIGGSIHAYAIGSDPVVGKWSGNSVVIQAQYEMRFWWGSKPPWRSYIYPTFSLDRPARCI